MTTHQQIQTTQGRTKTFEDVGVGFIRDNVGKIYLVLIAVSVVVIAVKEQIV